MLSLERLAIATALFVCLIATAHANIRDTFYITRDVKTSAHPLFGQGSHVGYLVNGVEGATMTFVRDSVYIVNYKAVDDDPNWHFYFTTRPQGGTGWVYEEIEDGRNAPRSTIVVLPTDETPDTLYYGGDSFLWVGGMVIVVDSLPTSSVEDDTYIFGSNLSATAYPNPVTDLTRIDFLLDRSSAVRLDIIDPLGHIVSSTEEMMDRGDRKFIVDAEPLADGLYFFRIVALAGDRRSVMRGSFQVIR